MAATVAADRPRWFDSRWAGVLVEPEMNTYQDYFFGLTADSDTRFKIDMSQSSPFEGRTARKGGEPTEIMLKCDPQGTDGIYVAHLCFILPEEPTFSKFYKITCTAGEATRDPAAGA